MYSLKLTTAKTGQSIINVARPRLFFLISFAVWRRNECLKSRELEIDCERNSVQASVNVIFEMLPLRF